jgi:hypothetical protein
MRKNGFIVPGVVVITFLLVLSGCSSIDTLSRENRGTFQDITVPAKDFQSLGLVFTEVSFDTDAKGSRGDIFTYNALLKEAQKLGADTIVNVVIDVKREGTNNVLKLFSFSKGRDFGIISGKETWYGSATAIKYTESLKNVDTTVVTDQATTTTSETTIMNRESGSTGSQSSTRKWWNPFTWFKK